MVEQAVEQKQHTNLKGLLGSLFQQINHTNNTSIVEQFLAQQLKIYGVTETEEDSNKILKDIGGLFDTVESYFNSLQEAKKDGFSRSQWLLKQLETSIGTLNDKNEIIEEIKKGLSQSNNTLSKLLFDNDSVISKTLKDYSFDGLNKGAVIKDFLHDIQDNTLLNLLSSYMGKDSNHEETTEEVESVKTFFETSLQDPLNKLFKKAATTGLLIAQKKEWIPSLKGKSVDELAYMADKGLTSAKVAYKLAIGELNPVDAIDNLIDRTTSTVCTIVERACQTGGGQVGRSIGTFIGSYLGPVGATVCGQMGQYLGEMAGEKVGTFVSKGIEKLASKTKEVVRESYDKIKYAAGNVWSSIKSIF